MHLVTNYSNILTKENRSVGQHSNLTLEIYKSLEIFTLHDMIFFTASEK